MQCFLVKSDEFENSSHLIYFPYILIMLLLAPYGRSTAINITCLFDYFKFIEIKIVKFKSHTISVHGNANN